jgi:hypothetical protein
LRRLKHYVSRVMQRGQPGELTPSQAECESHDAKALRSHKVLDKRSSECR